MRKSYRNVLAWGDPDYKPDNTIHHHIQFFQKLFGMEKAAISQSVNQGNEEVKLKKKSRLGTQTIRELIKICGNENVVFDDFSRAKHSYGKYYGDLMRLRLGIVNNPPDAVVYPKTENEIIKLVQYCDSRRIPIIPFGLGSSVTRALEAEKGGISVDVSKNFTNIIELNTTNSTVTVEAGVSGPVLEKYLNERGYTCGHFPQSFEYSTVGGWVAAKGAGQASTGYGRIENMLVAMTVVTPSGVIHIKDFPAASIGPDFREIFIGSEGMFGIITRITIKARKYNPYNTVYASYMFHDFVPAVEAMREMMQAQCGVPHLFRISDPEETEIGLQMKGKDKGITGLALKLLGFKPMRRTLMYAAMEGDSDHNRLVAEKLATVARRHKGFSLGAYATEKWLEQRYSSAYMRDPLMDNGIRLDTLETACTWDKLYTVWNQVRSYVKGFPHAICLTHISHVYETGANLYFVFGMPMKSSKELEDFEQFHRGIIDAIFKSGGSLSHHHGIGRLTAPWFEKQHGKNHAELLRSVKKKLDPKGIMNPGVLGM